MPIVPNGSSGAIGATTALTKPWSCRMRSAAKRVSLHRSATCSGVRLDIRDQGGDAVGGQLVADVFVDHLRPQLVLLEEGKLLQVAHDLGHRLRERGEVEDGPRRGGIVEDELLGE